MSSVANQRSTFGLSYSHKNDMIIQKVRTTVGEANNRELVVLQQLQMQTYFRFFSEQHPTATLASSNQCS